VATVLWWGQRTVLSRAVWRGLKATWPVLSRTHNGQPYEEEREPWYYRAKTVLKDVVDGPLTVDDLLGYFEDYLPTDEQNVLFRRFITEDGDQKEIMVQLLRSIQETAAAAV
jgi:hypothetical protein